MKNQVELKISNAVHESIIYNNESLIETYLDEVEQVDDVKIKYINPNFILELNNLTKKELEEIGDKLNQELEKESIPYDVFEGIKQDTPVLFDLYETLIYGEVLYEYPNEDIFADLLTEILNVNKTILEAIDFKTAFNLFTQNLFQIDGENNIILFRNSDAKIPLDILKENIKNFDKDNLFNSLLELKNNDVKKIIELNNIKLNLDKEEISGPSM